MRKWDMLIAGAAIALGVVVTSQVVSRQSKDDKVPPANYSHQKARFGSPQKAKSSVHLPLRAPRLSETETRAITANPIQAITADPNNLDLLVAWASHDPEAALAWIKSGRRMTSYEQMLGAVATGILIEDGVAAMNRFVDEHQNDESIPAKNQGRLEPYVFFNLGREDTIDTALGLLRDAGSSELAGRMVLGVKGAQEQIRAIDYLEAKGIPVSVSYWAFQESIVADPRYWADWADQRDSDLLTDIVQAWARQEPEAAKGWIRERVPANDPRRQKIEERLAPKHP